MTRAARVVALAACVVSCSLGSGEAVVPSAVDTREFDGRYALVVEESFGTLRKQVQAEGDPNRRTTGESLLKVLAVNWADLRVDHGVIRAGRVLVQEFSLITATRSSEGIAGTAVWHEDVKDPGDMSRVEIALRRSGDRLELRMGSEGEPNEVYVYSRLKE